MEPIDKLVFIILICAVHGETQPAQNCTDAAQSHRLDQFDQQLKESQRQIQGLRNELYRDVLEIRNCNCQNDSYDELLRDLSKEKKLREELDQKVKQLTTQMAQLNASMENCCNVSSDKPVRNPDSVEWLAGGKKIEDTYQNVFTKIIETNNKTEIFSYNSGGGCRMSVVDNKLWYASKKKIFSLELNNGEFVEITQSTNPKSFYQYSKNSILMASESGLYVVNTTGSIQYKIGDSNSEVTDISVEGNVGVAYYRSNNSVVVLELKNNIWSVVSSFVTTLPGNLAMSILLRQNTIILCSYWDSIIHTYNLQGQFTSSITTGNLLWPFLCGSDGEGSIMVCDDGNKVLKVLTPSGEWQQYTLPGIGDSFPRDVVINSKGEVYVLVWKSWLTIVKYLV